MNKLFKLLCQLGRSNLVKSQLCHFHRAAFGSTNIPYSIGSSDFNHDGHMDLLAGSQNRIDVWLGIGNSAPKATTAFNTSRLVRSICTRDYNGDNIKDFYLRHQARWQGNKTVKAGLELNE